MRRSVEVVCIATIAFVFLSGGAPTRAGFDRSENMTGAKQRRMRNCPSSVPGATTVLVEHAESIELRIFASDPSAIERIRALARGQAGIRENIGEIQHTGTGTGGGRMGFCPVMHSATEATARDIDGGASIFVRPRRVSDLVALVGVVRARVEALARRAHSMGSVSP